MIRPEPTASWLSSGLRSSLSLVAVVAFARLAAAQSVPVRNYDVQFTGTPPVADGVVGANEWSGAAAAAGSWGVQRETAEDVDTENNRFRMLWDATNLYILYETDFDLYLDADKIGAPNPNLNFNFDNLNLYVDPNTDDDPNFTTDPENVVDGYQFAFNQFRDPDNGSLISTNADRQGVGFFTEAHVGTPFGDQAGWNKGQLDVTGPAMQNIVVAQSNGTTGGVAEIVWPWANFNANATTPGITDASDYNSDGAVDGNDFLIWQRNVSLEGQIDKSNGDGNFDTVVDAADLADWMAAHGTNTREVTGLDHLNPPVNGEEWFFNMARINGQGDVGNFLPIWNWHEGEAFAPRPHGTITFQGGPAAVNAVPEPSSIALTCLALSAAAGIVRRRTNACA